MSAIGSAVGVLALMTLVLLATRGHGNPLASPGGAGSSAASAGGGVVGSGSAAPARTAAPGSTAPTASPTATAPADLRRLLAHVRCPPMPAKRPEVAKNQLVGFSAVAALRCEVAPATLGREPGMPLRMATADVGPLVAALERPDALHDPGRMCPLYEWAGPTLVLVDASGHTLVAQYPTDSCGHPQGAVLRLLRGPSWTRLPAEPLR